MNNYIFYNSFYINVDDIHQVFVREYGNINGIPVLFLHGGPGVGTGPEDTRFFDPNYFRVILIDQRGSGKSIPLGCLTNNTIDHLISDIEQVRILLNISYWHIFGGSWGSTLALYYAIHYPNHCISLILRGICLMENYDIKWWLNDVSVIYPDIHSQFLKGIDLENNNILDFYYNNICLNSDLNQWNYQWFLYEISICKLKLEDRQMVMEKMKHRTNVIYSSSRIMTHYFKFCRPNILSNCHILLNIPIFVVHGRYDAVCPIINAFKLKEKLPNLELTVAEMSGHSSDEPQIEIELKNAMERIKIQGSPCLLQV